MNYSIIRADDAALRYSEITVASREMKFILQENCLFLCCVKMVTLLACNASEKLPILNQRRTRMRRFFLLRPYYLLIAFITSCKELLLPVFIPVLFERADKAKIVSH